MAGETSKATLFRESTIEALSNISPSTRSKETVDGLSIYGSQLRAKRIVLEFEKVPSNRTVLRLISELKNEHNGVADDVQDSGDSAGSSIASSLQKRMMYLNFCPSLIASHPSKQ